LRGVGTKTNAVMDEEFKPLEMEYNVRAIGCMISCMVRVNVSQNRGK